MSLMQESWFHNRYVHLRRCRAISEAIVPLILPEDEILDVGCGDGLIANLLIGILPKLRIQGVERFVRSQVSSSIRVSAFDGTNIPFANNSFDWVLFVDVLHHIPSYEILLLEASRIARKGIIIKDHDLKRPFARKLLAFMDWFANKDKGFPFQANYFSYQTCRKACARIGLKAELCRHNLGLYPFPVSCLFEHGLHFLACFRKIRNEKL